MGIVNNRHFESLAADLGVSPTVHSEDLIYRFLVEHPAIGPEGAPDHYFNDGHKSAATLRSLVERDTGVNVTEPWKLLEFASGYGCVTRHLAAAIPHADITACDIHPDAIEFIERDLHTKAVLSVPDPDTFWLGQEFDVVFALSFFSHMPINSWARWLKALFRHVSPRGALIFTTHGNVSRDKLYGNSVDLGDDGFWFVPSSEQADISAAEYGTTITSSEFVTRQIYHQLRAPISLHAPGMWWGHQDVYVVTRR